MRVTQSFLINADSLQHWLVTSASNEKCTIPRGGMTTLDNVVLPEPSNCCRFLATLTCNRLLSKVHDPIRWYDYILLRTMVLPEPFVGFRLVTALTCIKLVLMYLLRGRISTTNNKVRRTQNLSLSADLLQHCFLDL